MKKLLDWANGCICRWDWKDVALLKFCMLALGVLVGLAMPHRGRRLAKQICAEVFLMAWATLMVDCFRMTLPKSSADSAEWPTNRHNACAPGPLDEGRARPLYW